MNFLALLALILAAWGIVVLVRKVREGAPPDPGVTPRSPAAPRPNTAADDEIDYEELERAEEEVRDLDVDARPEDGFEGDDWGPGAPQPPKPPLY